MKVKRLFLVFVLCLFNSTLLAQAENFEWSEPYEIDGGSAPKLGIDPDNGHMHVIYSNNGLNYVHLEFKDETFIEHESEKIPGADQEQGFWWGGGAIAVDQNARPHVLYRTNFRHTEGEFIFNYRYIKKTESGWSPNLNVKNDVIRGFNVEMAIDNSNRVHLSWTEKIDQDNDGFYYRIENHEIVKKQENFNNSRWDNGHGLAITPDGSQIHIVFGHPYPRNAPLSYYYSANAGNSFILADNIEGLGDYHVRNGHPDIYLDQNGNSHICYGRGANSGQYVNAKIQYVQYQNINKSKHNTVVTGGTEAGDLVVTEEFFWYISDIATGPTGKNIAIIYQELNKEGASYNTYTRSYDNYNHANEGNTGGALYVRMSADYGNTWSEATKLTDFCHMYQGRTMPAIESYQDVFYVIYETSNRIFVRAFPNDSDPDPIANAGGPYAGAEGDTIVLDASLATDTGLNAGIAKFQWDMDFDGVFDIITTEEKYPCYFTDNYSGNIVLKVTDNNNQVDYDTTQVTIVNIPPQINAGPDTTINEGSPFIRTAIITDPGYDLINCIWRVNNKTFQGVTLSYTFADNGDFTVIAFAQDDDGGEDSDTLIVHVKNVTPVADAGGPYNAGLKVPVQFNAQGTVDPGIYDNLVFEWDLTNDWKYDVTGIKATKTYLNTGKYFINLKVTDKDGASDSTTTYVIVTNEKPRISGLTNQIIQEKETFNPLNLDDYVDDPDERDSTLVWTASGQNELIVKLENRVLTVSAPYTEWFGKETLKLIVADAGGLKDSIYVQFQIMPVNDPPQWIAQVPDTSVNEDDTLTFALSTLREKVTDKDNTTDQLQFSIVNSTYLFWHIDSLKQQLKIYPKPNWNGKETLYFKVSDPMAAFDLDTCRITVIPQPDPPDTFSLVSPLYMETCQWPDTTHFKWRPAIDSDGVSNIVYIWTLEKNHVIIMDSSIVKTSLTYITNRSFETGLYRWYVTAFDQDLNQKRSSNVGFIAIIDSTTHIEDVLKTIPEEFVLMQNFPNPFNPETHITYHLPQESYVDLTVYNQIGQVVKVLQSGQQQAGIYSVIFDGKSQTGKPLSSGVYLYKLQTDQHFKIKKMILIQ